MLQDDGSFLSSVKSFFKNAYIVIQAHQMSENWDETLSTPILCVCKQ